MEKLIGKIMFVSFVCGAFLVGYTIQVLNTLLSSSLGAYARVMDSQLVSNLLPVGCGIVFLIYMYSSKKVKTWAQEVIVEVSKVVWPSKKDTTAMTIFVCIFMLLSGVLLGLFDFFSSQVIQFIIEMS
jgi:preprotein translocase subunit SecE